MTQTPLSQEAAAAIPVAAGLRKARLQPGDCVPAPIPPIARRNAPVIRPGRFCVRDFSALLQHWQSLKEVLMFEEQPQQVIDALMRSNPEFRQLYQRHRDLDKKVMDAELGVLPIDDVTLSQMKREKLAAKDRLVRLYDADRH